MGLAGAVARIFDLIFLLLTISILLTWVPNINWYNEPFKSLRSFSELFLAPFRKFIPPLGMIDISPIIALFCLGIIRNIILSLMAAMGL